MQAAHVPTTLLLSPDDSPLLLTACLYPQKKTQTSLHAMPSPGFTIARRFLRIILSATGCCSPRSLRVLDRGITATNLRLVRPPTTRWPAPQSAPPRAYQRDPVKRHLRTREPHSTEVARRQRPHLPLSVFSPAAPPSDDMLRRSSTSDRSCTRPLCPRVAQPPSSGFAPT